MIDRVPPQNINLEESLISSLLIDNSGFDEIYIKPSDFYKSSHQKIFQAMLNLKTKKDPVDLMTVAHKLQEQGLLEEVGGATYLSLISDSAPVALNASKYAKDIKALSVKREMITTASSIIEKAYSNCPCDELISQAQSSVLAIQDTSTVDNLRSLNDCLMDHLNKIEKYQTEFMPEGFRFGLPYMDKILRIQGSNLIVIAAKPSVGKTAFALSAAKFIAENNDTKVGFLSLEMDIDPLLDRILSIGSNLNNKRFYIRGSLEPEENEKLMGAAGVLSRVPLYIDESGCRIEDIERKCRKMKKDGFGIIFIDQLSKIPGEGSEFERYTRNCNRIALLKKELQIPIVLLSQLKRDSSEKEPTLSDLKQTGALEEDADIVLFLNRPYKQDKSVTPNKVKIVCAKNRQGPEGFDEGEYFKANRGMFKLGEYVNKPNIDNTFTK